jgi:hypothetical protein
MKIAALIFFLILSSARAALADCYPIAFSAYTQAPSNIDGCCWVSLNYKTYGQTYAFSFPWTVPEGHRYFLTDVLFQAKNIPGQRPSYLVLDSLFTITSDIGRLHMRTPLILQPGFILTGMFDNNTTDSLMNIIAVVNGVLVDSDKCWEKWK